MFEIFIVSAVLALAVAEIDAPTDAGVVNIDVLATVDLDPDVLNDADKLGLGSLLPGQVFGRAAPIPLDFPTGFASFIIFYQLQNQQDQWK